ncbi:MAG: site-2 protease family protein [Gemmatimonadales bacterium]
MKTRRSNGFDSLPVATYLSLRVLARNLFRRIIHRELGTFERVLLIAPILLFSMVAHEYAHGYAALKQGDNTAQMLGRLTWNPIKHIDPFLTILLPGFMLWASNGTMAFGGAKPVPVNPRLYRNYRRGDIIVSMAGIVTNLAIALLLIPLVIVVGLTGHALPAVSTSLALLQAMFVYGVFINLLLAAFNLIPIPPLDGSHVMKHLLPPAWAWRYQQAGRYGMFVLVALLTFGRPIMMAWMSPVIALNDVAMRIVGPYLLGGPWSS